MRYFGCYDIMVYTYQKSWYLSKIIKVNISTITHDNVRFIFKGQVRQVDSTNDP